MAGERYPFRFKQCISVIRPTGHMAASLAELREKLKIVSEDAIFHHTYQYFLKGHLQEYTNDFAHWAAESIEEHALSEHLSNLDPYTFENVGELRAELLRVIEMYIEEFPEPRAAVRGNEFFFNASTTLVFPTGIRASNLAEFLVAIRHVEASSIYFHFYEARTRLKKKADDFSLWVQEAMGKEALASSIRGIDPFMHALEDIRGHLVEYIEEEVKTDMEAV